MRKLKPGEESYLLKFTQPKTPSLLLCSSVFPMLHVVASRTSPMPCAVHQRGTPGQATCRGLWLFLLLRAPRSTRRAQGSLPSNRVLALSYRGSNQSIKSFQIQKQSLIKSNWLSPLQPQTSLVTEIQPLGQQFPVRSFTAFTPKEAAFDLC